MVRNYFSDTRHPSPQDPKSYTRQEFLAECDINKIMAKYINTGELPPAWEQPPAADFGDFMSAPDFQTAQEMIVEAREAFARLPARVRDRFGSDPVNLLAFVKDPENRAEGIKLGLYLPDPELTPVPAAVAPPPPKGS